MMVQLFFICCYLNSLVGFGNNPVKPRIKWTQLRKARKKGRHRNNKEEMNELRERDGKALKQQPVNINERRLWKAVCSHPQYLAQ